MLIVQADFLIAQGDPTIIVLPLTSRVRKSKEPLHVLTDVEMQAVERSFKAVLGML